VKTIKLTTPLSEKDARQLRVRDEVFISGEVYTARDQAHVRALKEYREKKNPLSDLEGIPLFHCGPLIIKHNYEWRVVAAGPTTSRRMEEFEDQFLESFNPRLIIGKGGMGKKTLRALGKVGAAYCSFVGGAAVIGAEAIRKVREVRWLDLGVPEAVWIFEVKDFGPLTVTMDSTGKDLYKEVLSNVEKAKKKIIQKIEV